MSAFERFDALARNVLSVSNDAVRASIEADDVQIARTIVDELRRGKFRFRVVERKLSARPAGDRNLTSHERRLVQRLGNYFKMYPEQIRQLIAASGRVASAS
jgi:hypothetical protein